MRSQDSLSDLHLAELRSGRSPCNLPPLRMEEPSPAITNELLERVRAGDESANRNLVEILYPTVRANVRNHLRKQADHDDVSQEVISPILEAYNRFVVSQGATPLQVKVLPGGKASRINRRREWVKTYREKWGDFRLTTNMVWELLEMVNSE